MDKGWIPAIIVVIALMVFGTGAQKRKYDHEMAVLDKQQVVNLAGQCVKVRP